MLSKRQDYGSGIKEKEGKNIGALFKPEPDKRINMQFNKQAKGHAQVFILFLT
jgi:hypothetical protein